MWRGTARRRTATAIHWPVISTPRSASPSPTWRQRWPPPALVLIAGFTIQFAGAAMVLFDIFTRLGAVLLIVFTVAATAMFHRYWSMEDAMRAEYHFLLLTYNVFVIAALLLIM